MASKSIVFYTDSRVEEPIKSAVEKNIFNSGLPIVSCSLKPLDFGKNIVLDLEPGYITYVTQIKTALENSDSTTVFFCEHDCLYPPSHFYFSPPQDDRFYYEENNWRWRFGADMAITYDRLISLSGLCVNRELALDHYTRRLGAVMKNRELFKSREPALAREWGYEPGTKKKKRGGFSDDDFELFCSDEPIIDIRHKGTFSPTKVTLESFNHPPSDWKEIPIESLPYWDLVEIFHL